MRQGVTDILEGRSRTTRPSGSTASWRSLFSGAPGAARVRELVDHLETLDSVTRLTAALAPPLAP